MYRKPVTILNLKTNFTKKVVRFKTQQSLVIGRQTNQEIGLVELWKSPVHKAKLKRLEPYWENKTSYCLIGA